MTRPDPPEVLVLMGPTASGKTSLAIELARRHHGEVVSADSMQLYRGLDIGTAKPSAAEQAEVPHHLLDVWPMEQAADVFTFVTLADAAIHDIHSRGRLPIIAGGTGMYLKALLYGLDPLPGDAQLRSELDARYDSETGFIALRNWMAQHDPSDLTAFGHHRRKLIRALEVFTLTGQPLAAQQSGPRHQLRYPTHAWLLEWPREVLKQRISQRCSQMLQTGWIEEAKNLIDQGLLQTPTAHQALGYRLINEFLTGHLQFHELTSRISTATWQLARRQITWFRHQHPEAQPLPMPATTDNLWK